MRKMNDTFLKKKWVATSKNFNTNCTFCHSLNAAITERCAPVEIFSKFICIFWLRTNWGIKKTDTKNWKRNWMFSITIKFLNSFVNFYFFGFWRKSGFIPNFFEKKLKIIILFVLRSKTDKFSKKPTFRETLKSVEKNQFFAIKK